MIGPWQVPVADAAVTLSGYRTYAGEAFAMGERSPLALIDPKAAARMAVAESLTNIVSADIESLRRVVLSANWMAAAGSNAEEQAPLRCGDRSGRRILSGARYRDTGGQGLLVHANPLARR